METWGVIGFFILIASNALGRLHTIPGIIALVIGIIVIICAGGDSAGALAIAGVVTICSSFVYNILGDMEITDIVSYITGVILIIVAMCVA